MFSYSNWALQIYPIRILDVTFFLLRNPVGLEALVRNILIGLYVLKILKTRIVNAASWKTHKYYLSKLFDKQLAIDIYESFESSHLVLK